VDPAAAERLVVAVVVLVSELAAPAAHLEALPVRLALELREQRLEDGRLLRQCCAVRLSVASAVAKQAAVAELAAATP
jgi:hypothetical protein